MIEPWSDDVCSRCNDVLGPWHDGAYCERRAEELSAFSRALPSGLPSVLPGIAAEAAQEAYASEAARLLDAEIDGMGE